MTRIDALDRSENVVGADAALGRIVSFGPSKQTLFAIVAATAVASASACLESPTSLDVVSVGAGAATSASVSTAGSGGAIDPKPLFDALEPALYAACGSCHDIGG